MRVLGLVRLRRPVVLLLLGVVAGCGRLSGPEANVPPVVTVLSPTEDGLFVRGDTISIEARAADPDGTVSSISCFVDGVPLGTRDTSPARWNWDTSGEPWENHALRVLAEDNDGAQTVASLNVRVGWEYHRPPDLGDGWETGTLEEAGLDLEPLQALITAVRRSEDSLFHGILIVRHGKLVFEEYGRGQRYVSEEWLTFGPDSTHNIASITKTVTSILVGIGIDEGALGGVGDRAVDLFPAEPGFKEEGKDQITLEHLLTMSSGLHWDQETYPLRDPRNDIALYIASPDPLSFYASRPLDSPPGTVFNYSEASINTAARALEQAVGESVDVFAQEKLFDPLSISPPKWLIIRPGFVWASGNLEMRPRDLAKLGQLFLDGGMWKGHQVVSEAWVDASIRPFLTFPQDDRSGYGYAWWVGHVGETSVPTYFGSGLGGQKVYVLPSLDAVVVLTAGAYWVRPRRTPESIMSGYVIPAFGGG